LLRVAKQSFCRSHVSGLEQANICSGTNRKSQQSAQVANKEPHVKWDCQNEGNWKSKRSTGTGNREI
jgi:hypothetical protein